jgi:hypothetical protein
MSVLARASASPGAGLDVRVCEPRVSRHPEAFIHIFILLRRAVHSQQLSLRAPASSAALRPSQ